MLRIFIVALFLLCAATTHASALTERQQALQKMLETWDRSTDDKANLLQILPAYGIDTAFMTSNSAEDAFIEQEVRGITRIIVLNDTSSRRLTLEYHNLRRYVRDDEMYAKLEAFFKDMEDISSDIVTARAEAERKRTEEAQKIANLAMQKEREQQEQERSKRAEERARRFEKRNKQAQKAGYTTGICYGIEDTIHSISSGISLKAAKKCLIEAEGTDRFTVQSLVGKYVIYYDAIGGMQVAVVKEPKRFYGQGEHLDDGFFKIVGTRTFLNVLGVANEIVVLKAVDFVLDE